MRITHQTRQILHVLLEAPDVESFGYEISEAAGLTTGTVYPILHCLERVGWLECRVEDLDERDTTARRRRRYYRLTPEGQREAYKATADQRAALRLLVPGWRT